MDAVKSLRCECVAVTANEVVRGEDVGQLLFQQLTNGEREFLSECVFVGVFDFVFAFFCGFKKGMVAGSQPGFKFAPCAVDGSQRSA